MIEISEREPADPDMAAQRGGRDPIELRMAIQPRAQGLVWRFFENQRQRVRQDHGEVHANAASGPNSGCQRSTAASVIFSVPLSIAAIARSFMRRKIRAVSPSVI